MSKNQDSTKPVVAVFGAAGYTGRFVIAELLSRKMKPVAIARNSKALSAANLPQSEVSLRQAIVDDATSLDRALHDAQVVINCAGPFVDTADAVASAALRAGIHYVDVAAEQVSVDIEGKTCRTAVPINVPFAHVWTVRESYLERLRAFMDTAVLAQALAKDR